jgi:tetratricopeptide (TPR) repeat protein
LGKKVRPKKGKRAGSAETSKAAARLPLWLPAIVALVAIAALLRTLPYEFVFDDQNQILRNPWIRDWSHAWRFFTTDVWAFTGEASRSNYYRPLQMLLYTSAHSMTGLQPQAFHLFNILLHAGCSLLVALIGFRLAGNRFVAIAGGLIFALHPIHAESVAWISGVTDPLCAVFYFSALYFYWKDGQEEKHGTALILTLGLFMGALLSKEMAFTFPLAAAWLDWCLHKKLRWPRYAMLTGAFALYSVMRVNALEAFFVHQVPIELDAVSRTLSSVVLLAQYIVKMFVPHGISAAHVFEPTTSAASASFVLSAAALASIAAAAWFWRGRRVILFLIGYGLLTLAPLLNLTGIGENVFADRYLYIPSLASSLLIPLIAAQLVQSWAARPRWLNMHAAGGCMALLLGVYAWMLWGEVEVWRDSPTLYLETTKRAPGSALMAHNLACSYYFGGDLDRAREWELKALESWQKSFIKNRTNLAEIYSGLGGIYSRKGNADQARVYFDKACAAAPDREPVLLAAGTFYISLQEYDQALGLFEAVIRVNPRNEVAYSNAAGVHLVRGRFDQSIACARKALDLAPNYGDACANLARAYAGKGMKEQARQAYMLLKSIDPSKTEMADTALKALDQIR